MRQFTLRSIAALALALACPAKAQINVDAPLPRFDLNDLSIWSLQLQWCLEKNAGKFTEDEEMRPAVETAFDACEANWAVVLQIILRTAERMPEAERAEWLRQTVEQTYDEVVTAAARGLWVLKYDP